MAEKFKKRLISKSVEVKKENLEQEKLRKKHNVEDENVKVVEKTNYFGVLANIIGVIISKTIIVFILVLAFIGLVCMVYPVPRDAFIVIMKDGFDEIQRLAGIQF